MKEGNEQTTSQACWQAQLGEEELLGYVYKSFVFNLKSRVDSSLS